MKGEWSLPENRSDADLVKIALGEKPDGTSATEREQNEAFEALISRHYRSVATIAYAALGSASELEDVLQSSFLSAFRSLGSLEDRSKFKYWLRAIAANQARDLARRRSSFGIPDSLDDLITLPEQETASAPEEILQVTWILEELTERLPERYAQVLYMRYYLGYTVKEVAEMLGIDAGLVKWRANRARGMAKQVLRGSTNKEVKKDGQIGTGTWNSSRATLSGSSSELH